MLLLEVDAATLESIATTSCEQPLSSIFRNGSRLFDHPGSVQRFQQAMQAWIAHASVSQELNAPPTWQDAAQRELLDVLSEVLASSSSEPSIKLADANRVSIVNRALDYMHAHIEESLQVIDICAALKVSRRTLQSCFQHVMGVNPQQFLRAHRLSQVRKDLLNNQGELQIKDVVERWGFWHLSRFAESYRKQFGELPSSTLQKGRSLTR